MSELPADHGIEATASTPRVVLAHPLGNQFFRHLASALRHERLLAEACTCVDWNPRSALARLLPRALTAELGRRDFSAALGVPVARHPARELIRLVAGRLGWKGLTRHETGMFSVDVVYRDFDEWVARRLARMRGTGMVYAYEDAAEASFRAGVTLGWRRVYDLPIAYWTVSRELLEAEAVRWPEWEPTLIGTRDSEEKLERKTRELALADLVVCPSRFVADSLPPDPRGTRRVVVAPFGSPDVDPDPVRRGAASGRPLRVLFAGAMTQRKGLADLFSAVRGLRRRDIELVVMGSPVAGMDFYRRQLPDFTHEMPRPHADVLTLMRSCDVFCLPSIVEGRALVVQEAMSVGLPAIITANTGADDVVVDGQNGFVVPIRAPETIGAKLAWFADHRAAVAEFGARAREAAARFAWVDYGRTITAALRQL